MMNAASICAVIVTYNPTASLIANVAALRPQVSSLIIVDNHSNAASSLHIHEACRQFDCELVTNEHNLGIAAALNIGIRRAQSYHCEAFVLFDQDSSVDDAFISSMGDAYRNHPRPDEIGIIAPRYLDRSSLNVMPLTTGRFGKILASMTSGSFMPARVFNHCGDFDESLFMDYVDHEYCLRIRAQGFLIIQAENAVLVHSLGNISRHKLFGCVFTATNHRPSRRYYMTRNRIWLYKKYLNKDLAWILLDAKALISEACKITLVETDRGKKWGNMLRGARDAFLNRMGNRMTL